MNKNKNVFLLTLIFILIFCSMLHAVSRGNNKGEVFVNNIGIGTTEPIEKLEVKGNIKTTYGIIASTANFTGDIVVGGKVDGRDIGDDGIKLDAVAISTGEINSLLNAVIESTGILKSQISASGEPLINQGTTSQYYRGDKTWQTLDKEAVGLGNVANVAQVTQVTGTGPIQATAGTTPTISISSASETTDGYLKSSDWNTFNNKQSTILENSEINLYSVKGTSASFSGEIQAGDLNLAFGVKSATGVFTKNVYVSSITFNDGTILTSTATLSISEPTQWTNVSGGINYSLGNVGIGTTEPTAPLTIAGTIKTILNTDGGYPTKNVAQVIALGNSGVTGAQNWALRGAYQYAGGIALNADGGNLDLIKSLDGNTILATRIDGASLGNVGIGTTSPNFKLHLFNNQTEPDYMFKLARVQNTNDSGMYMTFSGGNIGNSPLGYFGVGHTGTFGGTLLGDNELANALILRSEGPIQMGTNGTNVRMTIDNAGNVGIGTTNPENKLDVYGNIRLKNNGVSIPNLIFSSNGGVVNRYIAANISDVYDGEIYIGKGTTVGQNPLMVLHSNGLVSIGTGLAITMRANDGNPDIDTSNAPVIQLKRQTTNTVTYVNQYLGSIEFFGKDNSWIDKKGASITAINGGTGVSGALCFVTGGEDTQTEKMRITAGGNVGIGTINPQSKLDVQGSVNVSGSITANNFSGSNTGDETQTTIKTKLGQASGSSDGYLSASDWNTFSDKLSKSGDTMTGQLTVTSTVTIQGNSFSVGTSTFVVKDGNVGIGTTNPGAPLEISKEGGSGTETNLGLIVSYNSTNQVLTTGGTSIELRGSSATGGIKNHKQARIRTIGYTSDNAHGLAFDVRRNDGAGLVEAVRIDALGNVGIGTITPFTKLDIESSLINPQNTNANPTGGLLIKNTDSGPGFAMGIGTADIGYAGWLQTRHTSMATYTYPLLLNPLGGNVGIGTTGPSEKLEVLNGNIKTNYGISATTATFTGAVSAGSFAVGTSAFVVSGGNVSIGTTLSSDRLTIFDNSTNDVGLGIFNSTPYNAGNTAGSYITLGKYQAGNDRDQHVKLVGFPTYAGNGGYGTFAIKVLDAYILKTRMTILDNGNVGIGTTSPSLKLHLFNNQTEPDYMFKLARVQNINDSGMYMTFYGGNIGDSPLGYFGVGHTGTFGGTLLGANELANALILRSEGPIQMGTNGTNVRMTIDNSGNVGIGTTSPAANLHVNTTGSGVIMLSAPNVADQVSYQMKNGTGGWSMYTDGGATNNALGFYAHISSDTKMMIAQGGNVSIGTTELGTYKLNVAGTLNATTIYENSNALSLTYASVTALGAKANSVNPEFSGNVSVGTATTIPKKLLNVYGEMQAVSSNSDGASFGIKASDNHPLYITRNYDLSGTIANTGRTSMAMIFDVTTTPGSSSSMQFLTGSALNTAPIERMRISGNGNVGIGTANPQYPLDVAHNATSNNTYDDVLRITSLKSDATFGFGPSILFRGDLKYSGGLRDLGRIAIVKDDLEPSAYHTSGMAFYVQVAAETLQEKMRISGNGNVGIGITSPVYPLQVSNTNGDTRSVGTFLNEDTVYNNYMNQNVSSGVVSGIDFNWYSEKWRIGASRGGAGDISGFSFSRNGTTHLTIDKYGNVGIGTTDPGSYKLNVAGTVNATAYYGSGANLMDVLTTASAAANVTSQKITDWDAANTHANALTGAEHGATNANTANMIVRRDASGNFSAGTIQASGFTALSGNSSSPTSIEIGRTSEDGALGVAGTVGQYAANAVAGDIILRAKFDTKKIHLLAGTGNAVLSISSTSVGIGTTDLVGKLNVAGGTTILNSGDNISQLQLQRNGAFTIGISEDGTPNLLLQGGNVGIGTTSPQAKLEVSGDIKVTGNIIGGNPNTFIDNANAGGQTIFGFNTPKGSAESDPLQVYKNSTDRTLLLQVTSAGTSSGIHKITAHAPLYANSSILVSGSVGIGTTLPQSKLDIVGNSGLISFTGTDKLALMIKGSVSDVDYSGIDFTGYNKTTPTARIAVRSTGSGSYLNLGTSNNYDNGITNTAMTIDYSGNVGIGTANPTTPLDVNGVGRFSGTAYIGNVASGFFQDATNIALRAPSGGSIWFQNSGGAVTGMFISGGSGNVGIGTTDPSSRLTIKSELPNTYPFRILSTTDNTLATFVNNGSSGDAILMLYKNSETGTSSTPIYLNTNGNTYFNGGNVGIGTSSPVNTLSVGNIGSIHHDVNSLYIGTNFTGSGDIFRENKYAVRIHADSYDGAMKFSNTSSAGTANNSIIWNERMRIDSSGNVGIGTANPNAKLEISGGNVKILDTGSGASLLIYDLSGTRYGQIMHTNSGNFHLDAWGGGDTYINWYGGKSLSIGNGVGGYGPVFASSATFSGAVSAGSFAVGTSAFVVKNGNIGIGTESPNAKLNIAGTGEQLIRFDRTETDFGGYHDWEMGATITTGAAFVLRGGANGVNLSTFVVVSGANGNVGIGTTDPQHKLEVAGNILMTPANPVLSSGGSYITIPNGIYVSGGVPYFQTQTQHRGGIHNDTATYLQIDGGTSGFTYFSGNVGIGTANPQYPLDVAHNATSNNTYDDVLRITSLKSDATFGFGPSILFRGDLKYSGGLRDLGRIAIVKDDLEPSAYHTSGMAFYVQVAAETLQEKMRISGNGNVGIGITNPQSKLDVQGNVNVSGSITANNFSGSNTGDETQSTIKTKLGQASGSVDGYLSTSDWNTFSDKLSKSGDTMTGPLQASGFTALSGNSSSPASIGIGRTSQDGVLGVAGTVGQYAASAVAGDIILRAESDTKKIHLLAGTGNAVLSISSTSVGIGTTDLVGKLNVAGGTTILNSGDNISQLQLQRNGAFTIGISEHGTPNLLLQGGNVGIGTTSPQAKLEVSGDIKVTGNIIGGNPNTFIDNANAGGQTIFGFNTPKGSAESDPLQVYKNSTDRTLLLQVTSAGTSSGIHKITAHAPLYANSSILVSGSVGIGTTTPETKLTINGPTIQNRGQLSINDSEVTTAIGTGGFLTFTGYFNGSNTASYAGIQGYKEDSTSGEYNGALAFYTMKTNQSLSEKMRIKSDGNVGIGTTDPQRKLDVNGDIRTRTGHVVVGDNSGVINWGNNSTGNLYFRNLTGVAGNIDNYADRMTILANGSVGIGTANPQYPLDLAHNATANNTYDDVLRITSLKSDATFGFGPSILFRGDLKYSGGLRDLGRIAIVKDDLEPSAYHTSGMAFYVQVAAETLQEKMRISGNGNVGIGTTNPTTAKLVITTAAGATGLDLASSDSYAEMRVIRNSLGSDKDMYLGLNSGANSSMHLYSNNTETLTLKAGNVGIGTMNPATKFAVAGSFSVSANNLSASATSIDWATGSIWILSAPNNPTAIGSFSNATAGAKITVFIKYTGASQSVTFPSGIWWQGGTAPSLVGQVSHTDIVTFTYDGSNYYGSASTDYSAS